eukprot:41590-Eustigmatos_ZCMA.PRE.1
MKRMIITTSRCMSESGMPTMSDYFGRLLLPTGSTLTESPLRTARTVEQTWLGSERGGPDTK